jgi:hypothetical protein
MKVIHKVKKTITDIGSTQSIEISFSPNTMAQNYPIITTTTGTNGIH